jgi:uncharacterized membrane protein
MRVEDLLGSLSLSRSIAAAFLSRYRRRYSTCFVRISFMVFLASLSSCLTSVIDLVGCGGICAIFILMSSVLAVMFLVVRSDLFSVFQ